MNRTTFFAYARRAPFGGRLSQAQVEGVTAILDEWDRRNLSDIRWLAYILATAFHETGGKMQPIKEAGGDAYLSKYDTGKLAARLGNTPDADGDGQRYAGRGFVQITGRSNYRAFGIEDRPDEALKLPTATKIIFNGMIGGIFTGKKLADYFDRIIDNPIGARRIVNGTDKAQLIAGYHKNFLDALHAATLDEKPADVAKEDAKPDDKPASQSFGAITAVATPVATAVAIPMVTGINNVFALVFALALLCVGAFLLVMFMTGRLSVNRSKAL